jgi:cell wall-associated NlpC family hydrolase
MRTERRPSARRSGAPRRRRTLVVGLLLAGLLVVPTAASLPAGAQSIEDKRAEAARVADQLADLDRQLMDLNAKAEAARFAENEAQKDVAAAQARVDETNRELEDKRAELRSFALDAYKSGDDSAELNALLTAEANEAPAKKSYIAVTTGNRKDVLDSLAAIQRQAQDDTARLAQAQAEAKRYADSIATTRDDVDEATADQRALSQRVQGELATMVAAEQARRAEEARRAAEAAATAARAREAAAAAAPAPAPRAATTAPTPAPATRGGGGGGSSTPAPPPPGSGASGAIAAALTRVGIGSYVWGASGPVNFDCSGIVLWAYAHVGISLPHYSGAQYNVTTRISRNQLQAGDLVFWGPGGSEHVAIYMGGNQLVHAFGSGNGVRVTALDGWWKPPTGYGRI